jgi:hypothetical protein
VSRNKYIMISITIVGVLMTMIEPISTPDVNRVKLDLNSFSEEWRKSFTLSVNILAYFEAALEFCGSNPELERRGTAAAKECLSPETIAAVANYYRQRKLGSVKFIADNQAKSNGIRMDCADEKQKKWLRDVSKSIDDQVGSIADACRKCIFC